MDSVIDLGSELLVDRTKVRNPQLRLLLTALGEALAPGSAWLVLDKRVAGVYSLPSLWRSLCGKRQGN